MSRQLEQPNLEDISLPQLLQALGDPTRLQIVRELAAAPTLSCTALLDQHDIHKSTMSHHYKVLREAGLTTTIVDGRERFISLRREELEQRFPGLLRAIGIDSISPH